MSHCLPRKSPPATLCSYHMFFLLAIYSVWLSVSAWCRIVEPQAYKDRFQLAMDRYLMIVPTHDCPLVLNDPSDRRAQPGKPGTASLNLIQYVSVAPPSCPIQQNRMLLVAAA